MASATSKDLYIPLQTIYGKPNADGTYTLTALDIKALNDNLYNIAKKIQGRLTLSDMTSDAAAILVTDDSITMEVSNGSESSTITIKNNGISIASVNVTFTGMVTFSALAGSGTTVINGDNVTTGTLSANRVRGGTLEGVEVRSVGLSQEVQLINGNVNLKDIGANFNYGTLDYDPGGHSVRLTSKFGSTLKLNAAGSLSIDSESGTVYLGSSADGSNEVYIGRPGGRVDLYGDVYINGATWPEGPEGNVGYTLTATLTAADWTGTAAPYGQTVAVSGIALTGYAYVVAPASNYWLEYSGASIRMAAPTTADTATFYCTTKPTVDVDVNILKVRLNV